MTLSGRDAAKPTDRWFGDVPSHWTTPRLAALFKEVDRSADPSLPVLSVSIHGGVSDNELADEDRDRKVNLSEDRSKYQRVLPGDLVYNMMRAWQGAFGTVAVAGLVSPAYVVAEPKFSFRTKFIELLLQTASGMEDVRRFSKGIADFRMRLYWEHFRNIIVCLPPLAEQDMILASVHRECNRIDRLVDKKRRFIDLLNEKREAMVTHAVSRGIDPSVRLKPSGLEWLADIPAHWQVVPATSLFRESKERAREGDQMLSATQKYGVIPLADFEALEQRQVTMAMVNLDMRKHVELGDFVISMRSMDGGLERARAIGSVRSSYAVLKPNSEVDGRFYGTLMKSRLYIQALRLTSSFIRDGQDLNFNHVRKVRLPKLPVEEQTAIANFIEAETVRINDISAKTERSIELLKEHRAALIAAAVTGKIDIRELTPKNLKAAA